MGFLIGLLRTLSPCNTLFPVSDGALKSSRFNDSQVSHLRIPYPANPAGGITGLAGGMAPA